jgi:MCRA family
MRECTGEEITRKWLYHLDVPVSEIDQMAAGAAITRPCRRLSNHEMYSGGGPYFNAVVGSPISALQSQRSFFALENTH